MKSATPLERAAEASRLARQFEEARRIAMRDAGKAAQMSVTRQIHTFAEDLKAVHGKSGDALYEELISCASKQAADDIRTVNSTGGCFVAGILVHTNEGLKPIEEIRVGDWVLSQPEMTGEQAYKNLSKNYANRRSMR